MAAVTQTAERGAQFFATTPRVASDSSDKFTAGVYEHNEPDYSATMHGELISRWLLLETLLANSMWESNQ